MAFKAEVSPTRHTRRTRRTAQLKSSAQRHQSAFNVTFQSQSAKAAFKAEVSPTRHTRRTRPTPQLKSSAQLHHMPQLNSSAKLHHTPQLKSSAKLHQSGFKAALQSAFSRAGGAMPNRAIAHYFPP